MPPMNKVTNPFFSFSLTTQLTHIIIPTIPIFSSLFHPMPIFSYAIHPHHPSTPLSSHFYYFFHVHGTPCTRPPQSPSMFAYPIPHAIHPPLAHFHCLNVHEFLCLSHPHFSIPSYPPSPSYLFSLTNSFTLYFLPIPLFTPRIRFPNAHWTHASRVCMATLTLTNVSTIHSIPQIPLHLSLRLHPHTRLHSCASLP